MEALDPGGDKALARRTVPVTPISRGNPWRLHSTAATLHLDEGEHMLVLTSRRLALSIFGTVIFTLALTGCATASTPEPTAPMLEQAASVPESPGPTELLAMEQPFPTPPDTPETGPVTSNPDGSELLGSLEALPLEFAERGIWFANRKQALEAAGAPRPASFEDFIALPETQRKDYFRHSGEAVSHLLTTMRQTMPDWENAYGFSFFDVDDVTFTGMGNLSPGETNHIIGEFDEEAFIRSLTELGYRTESAGDEVYYAIRDDFGQDVSLTNPATGSALGHANRIFVGNNLLVVSPDTPPILQFLQTRHGEEPSVADSPAFASIAAELSDPQIAALLTREATLDPDIGIPAERVPGGRDRPEEWEVMHQWEAFGAGFSKTPDTAALRYSLYYPHRDWAKLDAGTLVERIESYMPRLTPVLPLAQYCESWSPEARVHGNGSTLTVKCEIPNGDESALLRAGVTSLVPRRVLVFLAP